MTLKFNSWLAVCISMFACAHLMSQEAGAATPRKAAIFVANHADKTLDDKLPALEDFISSRITGKGFSVISPEVATAAVSSLLKDSQQTEIDKALDNNSSALRLAQMLGADYIIMASISSYGTDKQTTQAYGVQYVTVTYTLRVTYKILEGVQGGTLAGGTFPVTSTKRFTENSRSDSSDTINDLLDQASVKIAESAGTKTIAAVAASSNLVEFSVACGMQNLAQLPVTVPDVELTASNTVVIGKERIPVLALDVMVELDGAGIGSTPATFKAAPGCTRSVCVAQDLPITREPSMSIRASIQCRTANDRCGLPTMEG